AARRTHPPEVDHHNPGKTTETLREPNEARFIPEEIDRKAHPRAEQEILCSVAVHLVRDAHPITGLRIPGNRPFIHTKPSVSRHSGASRRGAPSTSERWPPETLATGSNSMCLADTTRIQGLLFRAATFEDPAHRTRTQTAASEPA